MVPFFTSFLLRTIAWQSLFADNGPDPGGRRRRCSLDGVLDALHITTDGKIMNTPTAVIGGLTYNFLPFALLPIYVSLEKIPTNLFDAASDLYSPLRQHVPPGDPPAVAAGRVRRHAAHVHPRLGRLHQRPPARRREKPVIGGVIQTRFLQAGDFPTAAAISLVLMAIITAMVLVYARFLGTDDLV